MTREDIIRMAREAGFTVRNFDDSDEVMDGDNWHTQTEFVEDFARIVAAAEQEACAKVCEDMKLEWEDQPNIAQAEIATLKECAEAIRARGKK